MTHRIPVEDETYQKLWEKKAKHQARHLESRVTWDSFLLEKVDC